MRNIGFASLVLLAAVASCTSLLGDFDPPKESGAGGDATGSSQSTTHASTTQASSSAGTNSGGSASGGNGGGNTSSTSSTGGCSQASDCPDPVNPCLLPACTSGVCGNTPVATGQMAPKQVAGDCQDIVCDADGQSHTVEDHDDDDDGNPCTDDHCFGTTPHHDAMTGAMCSVDGGKFCNNAAQCVECAYSSNCPGGGKCDGSFMCHAATCSDSIQNENETGIDCGGPCTACPIGDGCKVDSDCTSAVCQDQVCRVASCADGALDGTETAIDCGGTGCGPCPTGDACLLNSDCQSGVCTVGTLVCG